MEDTEDFSNLVGRIYDAALDRALWPEVLNAIASYAEGSGAALFSKNLTRSSVEIDCSVGMAEEFKRRYDMSYVPLDPGNVRQFLSEIDEPVSSDDCMPRDEFNRTRFYRELVQPQRLIDFVTCALEKSGTSVAMFGVFRHERDGVCDEAMRRRMRLIAPHMRRAVLIGRVFDQQLAKAAQLADTLDHVAAPTFLVGARAEIRHANAAGFSALSAGSVVHAREGRLAARNLAAEAALRKAIALAAEEGDGGIGASGIAIPLGLGAEPRLAASVLPLASGAARRSAAPHLAAVAVFVTEVGRDLKPMPELVARAYKLTPTELRVLLAIVDVGGVPEVAETLGIGEGTVRTHLKSLFAKTGARRQADLVKIVARYAGGRTEA